jgi:hypothetical protein
MCGSAALRNDDSSDLLGAQPFAFTRERLGVCADGLHERVVATALFRGHAARAERGDALAFRGPRDRSVVMRSVAMTRRPVISVVTAPGSMTTTYTPKSATSRRNASVTASRAN